jgi:hypothetical protein
VIPLSFHLSFQMFPPCHSEERSDEESGFDLFRSALIRGDTLTGAVEGHGFSRAANLPALTYAPIGRNYHDSGPGCREKPGTFPSGGCEEIDSPELRTFPADRKCMSTLQRSLVGHLIAKFFPVRIPHFPKVDFFTASCL